MGLQNILYLLFYIIEKGSKGQNKIRSFGYLKEREIVYETNFRDFRHICEIKPSRKSTGSQFAKLNPH